MQIHQLRCEFLADPTAIDNPHPRLGWQLESDEPGQGQSAYQILVAGDPAALAADRGDLWDSGRVAGADAVSAAYAGAPLASRQECCWKIRVWDRAGIPSPWSTTATWRMGLLRPEDWSAAWIGGDTAAGSAEHPWLRREFTLEALPKSSWAYVNALGYFELYVNGVKAGDDLLSPAVTQYGRRSYYIAYDVAPMLRRGTNCLALWLGSGWYAQMFYGQGLLNPGYAVTEPVPGPAVRAQLEIGDPAQGGLVLATGPGWKTAPSPWYFLERDRKSSMGADRWARAYDARQDAPDWNRPGFDDRRWRPAPLRDVAPHAVRAQPVEPNRIQRRYVPVRIDALGPEAWQIDFGCNLAGILSLRFPGPLEPGRTIRLAYHDRLLDEKGEPAKPTGEDAYTASGRDPEVFRHRFNYQGFRYVRLSGLPQAPQDAEAFLVHTDFGDAASFACSNPRLTAIHDMVQYTFRCLTLGGYMADCPHIERLGYGGDGQASAESALMMFGLAPLYRSWLAAWRDCQEPDGDLPHTAPSCFAGGGPYWCGFPLAVSLLLYRQYADRETLAETWPVVRRWLDFVETHCPGGGLMDLWPQTSRRSWCLGDWAVPLGVDQKHEPSVRLIVNCYRILCCDKAARMASLLGHRAEADRLAAQAGRLRPLVHGAFFDPAAGTYADGDPGDLAFPLLASVPPEALRPAILRRLETEILVHRKGHVAVGLVGVQVLFELLTALDRSDLLFTMANQETYPGWGYMLANGATTTWEHWNGRRSHIHNCYNGIGQWFHQGLAGIRPEYDAPGFERFTVRPAVVGDLTWVRASHRSIRGEIRVEWWRRDERFELQLRVPPGSVARVFLPRPCAGAPSAPDPAVKVLGCEDRHAVFEARSGLHAFAIERPDYAAGPASG